MLARSDPAQRRAVQTAVHYLQVTGSWSSGNPAVWSAIIDMVDGGDNVAALHRLLTAPHRHSYNLGVTDPAPDELLAQLSDIASRVDATSGARSDITLVETAARLGLTGAAHRMLDVHQICTIERHGLAATPLPHTITALCSWADSTDPDTYRGRVDLVAQHDPVGVCQRLDTLTAAIRGRSGEVADDLTERHDPQLGARRLSDLLEQCASPTPPTVDDIVAVCGDHTAAAAAALTVAFEHTADVAGAAERLRAATGLRPRGTAVLAALLRRRGDDPDTLVVAYRQVLGGDERPADVVDLAAACGVGAGAIRAAAINHTDKPPAVALDDLHEHGLLDDDLIGALRGHTVERLSRRWPRPPIRAAIGSWIRTRIGVANLDLAIELAGELTLAELADSIAAAKAPTSTTPLRQPTATAPSNP
jgi:hypothetical protein